LVLSNDADCWKPQPATPANKDKGDEVGGITMHIILQFFNPSSKAEKDGLWRQYFKIEAF
jgi:hypothetical protein